MLIVPERLAVFRLVFHAKMSAARFVARKRIQAKQLGKFEKVRDATSLLEILIETSRLTRDGDIFPKLLAQLWNARQGFPQAGLAARHTALVPHDCSQFTM